LWRHAEVQVGSQQSVHDTALPILARSQVMRGSGHGSVAVGRKFDKPAQSRGKVIGGPRRHEEARHAIFNEFPAASNVCGDRRPAGRKPFDKRARNALPIAW
jgi:hypothetical protein